MRLLFEHGDYSRLHFVARLPVHSSKFKKFKVSFRPSWNMHDINKNISFNYAQPVLYGTERTARRRMAVISLYMTDTSL